MDLSLRITYRNKLTVSRGELCLTPENTPVSILASLSQQPGDNKHKCVRLLTHCENSSVISLSFLSIDESIADLKKTVLLLLHILSYRPFKRS